MINKSIFSYTPDLFIGCIVQSKKFSLMIASCEVYARDANIDKHLDCYESNFPYVVNAKTRKYKRVMVNILNRSDRGAIINKLQIGTTQFDLLITGSLLLQPLHSNAVSVGPRCNSYIVNKNLSMSSLLLIEKRAELYLKKYDDISRLVSKEINIEDVRQLFTLFQHPSTYLNYRSHLLEGRLTRPATIFTLSKYPTRGFGMSINNKTRQLSELFTILCECVLYKNRIITQDLLLSLKDRMDDSSNASLLKVTDSLFT